MIEIFAMHLKLMKSCIINFELVATLQRHIFGSQYATFAQICVTFPINLPSGQVTFNRLLRILDQPHKFLMKVLFSRFVTLFRYIKQCPFIFSIQIMEIPKGVLYRLMFTWLLSYIHFDKVCLKQCKSFFIQFIILYTAVYRNLLSISYI